MNLKKLRKAKLRDLKKQSKINNGDRPVSYSPNKIEAGHSHQTDIDEIRDPNCRYARICTLSNCLSCKRLK